MVEPRTSGESWTGRPVPESYYPLYAVNLDQRITYWNKQAIREIAPYGDAVGRRCYEVLPSLDPRNGTRCRPNCQVIEMAREGRAAPDFEVWGRIHGEPSKKVDVSILLQPGHEPGEMSVVHVVRSAPDGGGPEHARPPGPCAAGYGSLTPRQAETLRLLSRGLRPAEIASALNVRPVTVRNHIQGAMDRLGAHTRLEAVILAARSGQL